MNRTDQIRAWLNSADSNNSQDRAHLVRALRIVYANQTATEQAVGGTIVQNGKGFNGRDARIASSFVQSANRYGNVTPNMADVLKRILPKYARQIAEATPKPEPTLVA